MDGSPDPLARRVIPSGKIGNYLLDPEHPVGGPKARFFARFGFSREDEARLSDALLGHPDAHPVEEFVRTPHGTKFVVRCQIETPDRRAPCIVTIWMVQRGEPARLITAYPNDR